MQYHADLRTERNEEKKERERREMKRDKRYHRIKNKTRGTEENRRIRDKKSREETMRWRKHL